MLNIFAGIHTFEMIRFNNVELFEWQIIIYNRSDNQMNNRYLLIFHSYLLLFLVHPTLTHSAEYQCDVNGDNRLGLEEAVGFLHSLSGVLNQGPDTALDCGEPDYDLPGSGIFSAEAKRYILCQINQIRSEVALGIVPDDGTNGIYPIAVNMQRMRWNEDLATVAQNHATNCNYEHNESRDDDFSLLTGIVNPSVGENIAAYGISWTIGSPDAVEAIEIAFSGWNGENNRWYYDSINEASWGAGIGHFTQQIWAETTQVGCGQAWCPDGWPEGGLNMIFTVCNFYVSGNWWGEYPYQSGAQVCSEDMQPGDTCENGLIAPVDYETGIVYECDENNDGELGLEEVIHALQILTTSIP